MQRFSLKLIFPILLALVVLALLVSQCSNEQARIRKQLTGLEHALALQGKESLVASVSTANDIVSYFTEDTELEAGSPLNHISGANELKSIVVQARQQASQLKVSIRGMEIKLGDDQRTAVVALLLEGSVTIGRESETEIRAYDLHMEKVGGDWLIDRVKRTTTRPPSDLP